MLTQLLACIIEYLTAIQRGICLTSNRGRLSSYYHIMIPDRVICQSLPNLQKKLCFISESGPYVSHHRHNPVLQLLQQLPNCRSPRESFPSPGILSGGLHPGNVKLKMQHIRSKQLALL